LLESVDAACRNGNSNDLLEMALGKALFKFTIDDFFHAAVNLNALIVEVADSDAALNVEVDAFVHKGLRVLILSHDIEAVAGFKRESKSLVVLLQVVKHLRGDASGKLLFREAFLFHKAFNARQLV